MEPVYFYALIILLGTAIGVAVGVGAYLSEIKERSERPQELVRFREELQKTILREDVTWEYITILASSHSATSFGVKKALEALARQYLTSETESDKGYMSRVIKFLRELEAEEPFQDLPVEIQFHLKQIQEKLSDNADLLQPFARHLRVMMEERSMSQRRQRVVNYLSFGVGLVGLCFGIIGYLGW